MVSPGLTLAFELKDEVTGKTVPAFMEVKGVTLEKREMYSFRMHLRSGA